MVVSGDGKRPALHYYNEHDLYCVRWLRNLVKAGQLPRGDVDGRDIEDVKWEEINRFHHYHFFAGIGGWPLAMKMANWPDEIPLWTASLPCQPFSVAGRGLGEKDPRHLWPRMRGMIDEQRPLLVVGEQVASKDGRRWLAGIQVDMEKMGYTFGAADLCAAGCGAPHIRQRLWWVAVSPKHGCQGIQHCTETQIQKNRPPQALDAWHGIGNTFENWKEFMAETRIDMLDDGVSSNMAVRPSLRAFGNSIVPQVAAEWLGSVLDVLGVIQ